MSKVWRVVEREVDDLVEQLLLNRNIKSEKEREQFFNPKISDYQKLIEIPNIKKAMKRIHEAIKNKELIVVYGDYDVDGITASCILLKV